MYKDHQNACSCSVALRLFFGAALCLTLSVAGCNRKQAEPAVASTPAATAEIELKSPPARVSDERHTGPFSDGASLKTWAILQPLDPSPVKIIRLDTTHKIIEIAPGVKFGAWTFGAQVPGPTIRARVGDTIKFSMTNRSGSRQLSWPVVLPHSRMLLAMNRT